MQRAKTVVTVTLGLSALLAPLAGKALRVRLAQQALMDPQENPVNGGPLVLPDQQDPQDYLGLQGLAGTRL